MSSEPENGYWKMYDQVKGKGDLYGSNFNLIGKIASVQDFADVFKQYPEPSYLFSSTKRSSLVKPIMELGQEKKEISAISLFRDDITPEWEHEKNSTGGEFQCSRNR
jgi:hypothetical protein